MEQFADQLMNLYNDPWLGVTVGIVVVLLSVGLMWSRKALEDLIRGKWW